MAYFPVNDPSYDGQNIFGPAASFTATPVAAIGHPNGILAAIDAFLLLAPGPRNTDRAPAATSGS